MLNTELPAKLASEFNGDSDSGAQVRLWGAVLEAQLKDFLVPDKRRKSLAYSKAVAWFGSFPARDFVMVCDFAGFDPEAIHERALAIHNADEGKRKDALARMSASTDIFEAAT